jgi:hypothetical protein
MDGGLVLAAGPTTRDPASLLRAWCVDKASQTQSERILALLDFQTFVEFPLPPRTWRRAGVTDTTWYRYLWPRHVQHILYWREHKEEGDPTGFSEEVNWLLRSVLYPDLAVELPQHGDHARSCEGGGAESSREMSPAALRRQRRRAQYAARRVAERVAQVPLASESKDGNRTSEWEGLHLESSHNVPVIGNGPPLGSQEPPDISTLRVGLVVVPLGFRRGCAPWGRRGRGRVNTVTRPTDAGNAPPESSNQFSVRGSRATHGDRGGVAGRTVGRRGRGRGRDRGLTGRIAPVAPTWGSNGWIPPAILPNARSLFLLRPRSEAVRAGAFHYAENIRRSFQAFLDDGADTSTNPAVDNAGGLTMPSAAEVPAAVGSSGGRAAGY